MRFRAAIVRERSSGFPYTREKPRQQLPVATSPAMVTLRESLIGCRIIFDQIDACQQAGAGEFPFDQVVTQNGVFGKSPANCRVERLQIVDALAGEAGPGMQILIDS